MIASNKSQVEGSENLQLTDLYTYSHPVCASLRNLLLISRNSEMNMASRYLAILYGALVVNGWLKSTQLALRCDLLPGRYTERDGNHGVSLNW